MKRWPQWMLVAACLAGTGMAWAQGEETPATHARSRTYVGQDLYVPAGQQIDNVTCVFCSAQIEGDVSGRVVVLFGNLSVTGKIGGNVAVVDGNAVLDGSAHVGGDTVVLFGNAVYETEQVLGGGAWVVGGHASSFATHEREARRVALTPKTLTWMAVGVCGFIALLVVAGGRRRRPHA